MALHTKFAHSLYIYIYIYIYVLKKELLRLLKIKILYKKNKPKIKKRRYMKYFGYILNISDKIGARAANSAIQ